MIIAARGSQAEKIVKIAQHEADIHYREGRSSSGWNNDQKYSRQVPGLEWSNRQAWCATFVSWCAMRAGLAKLFPRTASTDTGAAWWQRKGRWSEYPCVGGQGYLAHGTDEYHTFIVKGFDSEHVYTVEGNTNNNGSSQGDGVYNLTRRRRDSSIEGYGVPKFTDGVISADPRFHSKPAPGQSKPTSGVVPPKAKLQSTRQRAAALIRERKAVVKRPAVRSLLERAARSVEKGVVK